MEHHSKSAVFSKDHCRKHCNWPNGLNHFLNLGSMPKVSLKYKKASREHLQSNAHTVVRRPFHLNTKWTEQTSCSHTINSYLTWICFIPLDSEYMKTIKSQNLSEMFEQTNCMQVTTNPFLVFTENSQTVWLL